MTQPGGAGARRDGAGETAPARGASESARAGALVGGGHRVLRRAGEDVAQAAEVHTARMRERAGVAGSVDAGMAGSRPSRRRAEARRRSRPRRALRQPQGTDARAAEGARRLGDARAGRSAHEVEAAGARTHEAG